MTDPFFAPDDDARALARRLMTESRHAALATLTADGAPFVTRIALAPDADGMPLTFVSRLSQHTQALLADPRASLLLGEIAPKGDPLTQPRLTVQVAATPITDDEEKPRDTWLRHHPGARLWIDFPDFLFFRLLPRSGFLNAGFARAYKLDARDLGV